MTLAIIVLVFSLALLVWSADKFVDGSAIAASYLGIPPLLIGMIVVGFGTSAPEMMVSAIAAFQGNPGIALGNAYGSNTFNIAFILGVTALISPVVVHSQALRKELPILTAVTGLAAFQLWDGELTRLDALVLIGVFTALMVWTVRQGLRRRADAFSDELESELKAHPISLGRAVFWIVFGLALLIISSRGMVWGAVKVARNLGISDLIIGLTIVAAGTSLPELASSIAAARKGEHDIAVGNIIGSNLFNTLLVVGIAGIISPLTVGPEVVSRDIPIMSILTVSLFISGYGFKGHGRISRFGGGLLLASYIAYIVYLAMSILAKGV
ncbi:MAG: calcium/sodium antiporter [Deltaproteobacteria bacterium RIFCSPLOWO2_02_FULL_53_8]|nr:MAG: calcium/sodium antiporter [Deltaproteobacteria bacterium RIFCSPLOWO2_02_FULL_53_8]